MSELDQRLPDGGPRYVETPAIVPAFGDGIAEPYNAASASLFVLIVVVFAWRLRGRFREHQFLAICMALLLIGGIGGTLYHATRASALCFWLDVGPIFALAALFSGRLWMQLALRLRTIAMLAAALVTQQVAVFAFLPTHAAVNASYVGLGVVVVAPMILNVRRSQGRGLRWMVTALAAFALALVFRAIEASGPVAAFPMGTHWLWHTFGAIATAASAEFALSTHFIGHPRGPRVIIPV